METETSGDIYYKQESNRLIIQYQSVQRAYAPDTCTFQVILYSDGRIEFQYNSMNGATDYSTVGIEDATRTLGIQLGYYSSYVNNGMAVAIIPASDFYTISPVSGIVSARSMTTLNGLFHSLQLPFGDYTANVAVTHDGGGTSPVNIAAKLTVQNSPSVVTVVYPTNQERLLEGQPITISVNATDVDSQITKVEFYDNGVKLGEDQNSYYQYAWASPTAGSHSITAKATDVYGAIAVSAPVSVQILADADHDGMEDAWETTYGLDTARDDSMEDFDGDRVLNIFEYRRDTLPNDMASVPETDFVVDPATGGTSSTDNIFSTIGEAASKANQSHSNATTHLSEYPSAYAVIQVKAGVYQESVYLSGVPVLLLGELGAPQGPVEIRSNGSYAVQLYSASAIDGFVISHAPGVEGIGVYSSSWSGDKNRLLTNCIIKGNKAAYGAAVYNAGNSILRLAHCTVAGNEASSQGRAIYNSYNATVNLVNCIFWGNVGAAPQEIYRETYAPGAPLTGGASCIIKDGEEGGINENPLLNTSGYLFSNSPAINRAGTVLAKCSKVDINGERRDQNSTPDLGADEYRDDNNVNDGDGLPDWAELTGASGATDDADGDGIANLAEYQSGLNPRWSDSDRDGLSDSAEINIYSSNPLSSDSDLDGLSDGTEVVAGTGVNNPDSDGDGIIDGTEVNQYGSNPLSADSDSDGMPDSWEYSRALNLTYNDAGEDPDFDGLSNLGEYQRGTEPWDFDTDGDGLGDGYETQYASLNPIVYNSPTSDTDNDGMGLLFEGIYGFNPEVADGASDLDGDGLTNAEEYTFQSDPQLVDTDDDGLSDYEERTLTTDPWNYDTDGDGLTDGYEVSVGLNPKVANSSTTDTDGDGLADIDEQKNGSNPLVADTDGDGTNDAAEVASGADPTSGSDGGQAPPPEQKFKVSFEIYSSGKTVTASCAKCHNLEVQVGSKTAGAGVTVELEKGRNYDVKLKDKPSTWRPAGQEPPHEDNAVYSLWPQPVDGQSIASSNDEKVVYAKTGEVLEYLMDNRENLLAMAKTWGTGTSIPTVKKAEIITVGFKPRNNNAINKGFDSTGSVPFISVESGALNETSKLVLGKAPQGLELKIANGDEDKIELVEPANGVLSSAETNIVVRGKGQPTVSSVATLELRVTGSSQTLNKLKVLVLPGSTDTIGFKMYKAQDPASTGTLAFASFPGAGSVYAELEARYEQARLRFSLNNTLDTTEFRYDVGVSGIANSADNGTLDLPASGLGNELQVFANNAGSYTSDINVVVVCNLAIHKPQETIYPFGVRVPGLNVVLIAANRWSWTDATEFNTEDDNGASYSFERIVAHEAGHFIAISTKNAPDAGHDPGPYPETYHSISLMRSGEAGKNGKWIRMEDWEQANFTGRNL